MQPASISYVSKNHSNENRPCTGMHKDVRTFILLKDIGQIDRQGENKAEIQAHARQEQIPIEAILGTEWVKVEDIYETHHSHL